MEIHNCVHCGTETQPNWRFCRRCGTALENLDQQPPISSCSNCSSPIADGWRYCFNCGTGTADATARGGSGLSSDEVAELIATPPTDIVTAAPPAAEPTSPVPPESSPTAESEPQPAPTEPAPPAATRSLTERLEPEPVAPEPVAPEPIAPDEPATPDVETAPEQTEPVITGMKVSFEADQGLTGEEGLADAPPSPQRELAPPIVEAATTEPPAPPMAASAESARAAAERSALQPPPAPPAEDMAPAEPVGTTDSVTAAEPIVSAEQPDAEEPAIHVPPRPADRTVRTEIPKPIGTARDPADTKLPQPLSEAASAPTAEDSAPRVAVPAPRPRPEPRSAEHLPPIDGRTFRNPGLTGQLLQLALIVTGAISVAMMLGLILLNNRLEAYAMDGEGLNRIESAESLINTWLRPLLALAVLGVYVFLVFWARRVTSNLSFFDRPVPETALWMWVVPLVNVFMLYRHLDLAWKGSDAMRRSDEWRRGRPDVWNLAFAVLVVIGFGLIIYGFVLGAETFEAAIDANAFSMIGYALLTASLLCAARAVGNVIDRQRTRAESFA